MALTCRATCYPSMVCRAVSSTDNSNNITTVWKDTVQYLGRIKVSRWSHKLVPTINDKSFVGKKFHSFLVHQVCGEKFHNFIHHHYSITTFVDSQFSNSTKQLRAFQQNFSCSSSELSWELSLADSEMDESTLLTRVCRFHAWCSTQWPDSNKRCLVSVGREPPHQLPGVGGSISRLPGRSLCLELPISVS